MIALSWTLFVLLALFWTGAAWISAAASEWVTHALGSGTATQAAHDLASLPLPEWLKLWIDPTWLQALQSGLQPWIDGFVGGLPLAAMVAGWLVPAIWIAWGLGMALLVLGAAGAHMLLRRFARRGRRAPMAHAA